MAAGRLSTGISTADHRLPADEGQRSAADGLVVRPAVEADRAAVGRVLAEGFPEKFGPIFGGHTQRTARILADLPPTGTVYVAEREGQIVGTLTLVLAPPQPPVLWPLLRRHLSVWESLRALVLLTSLGSSSPDSTTAVIEAVAVRPQARGQGVGRALMAHAMDAARRAGRARVALYVVEGNDAATHLYESLGFRMMRRHGLLWHRWLFGTRRLLYMVALLAP